MIDPLEPRSHCDAVPQLSAAAELIGQDLLLRDFPAVTAAGQAVAIIDTGIDYTNDLLGGGFGEGFKVIAGHDFVDDDDDPIDTDGHGTAVAGLIAGDAFERNGVTYQGLAPGASLIALRVAEVSSETPDSRIAAALQWVIDHRDEFNITAVNISLGRGHFDRTPDDAPLATRLNELAELNVFVAAASGNGGIASGDGIDYPAADDNAVAVGAVDEFDTITQYTERGKLLDLLAPGEDLVAPVLDNEQAAVVGTSFATPLVTAAAMLVQNVDPTLTPAEVLSILQSSGGDNFDGDNEFGATTALRFSRLDAAAAVRVADMRHFADSTHDPQFSDARNNAIEFDSAGVLHLAYHDAADLSLKYATRNLRGEWSRPTTIDGGAIDAGRYLALDLDSAGRPGMAYFDGTNGDLRYARLRDGAFVHQTVDSRQSVGLYPAVKFDSSNRAVIAYYHKTKGDLRVARLTGNGFQVDDLDANANDRGRSVSMAVSASGKFAVAYEDSTTGRLKFARQTAGGWAVNTIDNATRGVSYISLAFGPGEKLFASYYDASPADLKFATEREPSEFKLVTAASRGAVGLFSQIFVDDDGAAAILYYSKRDDTLSLATGTATRLIANRLQSAGGRFTSAAIDPNNGAIRYSWFDTSLGRIRFSEAFS